MIEYLHDSGKMPDAYYYQVNGKGIEENYIDIMRKRKGITARRNEIEKNIEKQIEKFISDTVDDILKSII